jgi:hypothetical protein
MGHCYFHSEYVTRLATEKKKFGFMISFIHFILYYNIYAFIVYKQAKVTNKITEELISVWGTQKSSKQQHNDNVKAIQYNTINNNKTVIAPSTSINYTHHFRNPSNEAPPNILITHTHSLKKKHFLQNFSKHKKHKIVTSVTIMQKPTIHTR